MCRGGGGAGGATGVRARMGIKSRRGENVLDRIGSFNNSTLFLPSSIRATLLRCQRFAKERQKRKNSTQNEFSFSIPIQCNTNSFGSTDHLNEFMKLFFCQIIMK